MRRATTPDDFIQLVHALVDAEVEFVADVVVRSDHIPGGLKAMRGAWTVAEQALMFSRAAESVQPVLLNGAVGIVSWRPCGQLFSVMGFTIRGNKIVERSLYCVIRLRLSRFDVTVLND